MIKLPPPGSGSTPLGGTRIKLPSLAGRVQAQPAPQEPTNMLGTRAALEELKKDPFSTTGSVKNVPGKLLGGFTDAAKNFYQKAKNVIISPDKSIAGETGRTLELISAGAGVVFSPVTAFFQAANEVPVLGTASRVVTLPFNILGDVGSDVSGAAIDKIPDSILSQSSKEKIKPGIQEISALALQIAAGKALDMGLKQRELVKKGFSETDASTIVDKAVEISKPKSETAGGIKLAPPEQTLGVAEPLKQYGGGEKTTAGLSESIAQRASEKGITVDNLPQLETIKLAEVDRIIKETLNKEQQLRIARLEEAPPADIPYGRVVRALEDRAILEGDVGLINELGTSTKIASKAREFGQEVRSFGDVDPESPIAAIKDVVRARASKTSGTKIDNINSETLNIKKEIKKLNPTKETWDSFIDSLVC